MEFRILGPLEVVSDGTGISLGGLRQRAVLALLLLRANEVVSRDRLIDGVWGERAPSTAARTLDSYISRLRAAVGAERIERRAPGYRVLVDEGELDLQRFEHSLESGRARLAEGDPRAAARLFEQALALWRGAALADLTYELNAREEIERIEEHRRLCREERLEALLATGHGADLVPELEQLVAEQPFRERPVGQLMVALYRSGRQADALARYQSWRLQLAREVGLEPGVALAELERRILAHDPSLRAGSSPAHPRRRARRRTWIVLAAASIAAAAVAAAVVSTSGSSGEQRARPANSDTLTELGGGVRTALPAAPSAAATGAGSIWLAEPDAGAVIRVDERSGGVVGRIPVGGSPGTIAFGAGAAWVASVPGDRVQRIDPATDAVVLIPLGTVRITALAFGLGKLWLADGTDHALLEVDPLDDQVARTVQLDVNPTAIAVGEGALWIADYDTGTVTRVDPETGDAASPVHVGNGPTALAVGGGAIWVVNSLDSTVSRIDPGIGAVTATITVGSGPDTLAVAPGAVWVGNEFSESVSRIDPARSLVTRTSAAPGGPTALIAAGTHVWVGTRRSTGHRGGTLVLLHTTRVVIDPALNLDIGPAQSDGLVRDGLVTYNHVGGPDGARLVPDLAIAIPAPTDGGRTYRFRLRPDIHYSDGRPVRARDFRRALERLFRLHSPGSPYFFHVLGARSCTSRRCDLSRGVLTDDRTRTVTFRLTEPDGDFLSKLTIGGLVTPVPDGTPWHDIGDAPIPGTGPYRIASANQHEIRYVRNPHFKEWSHAAQPTPNPDVIVLRFGLSASQEVRAVEKGRADWTLDGVPGSLLSEVTTRFGAQLHNELGSETDFLQLNTHQRPLNDLRVRQALNYAIDRRRVASLYGGPLVATPTCQVLPAGITGYRLPCPYTRHPTKDGRWHGPDLAKARALVAASGTRGDRITVWGPSDVTLTGHTVVPYVVRVLRRLGYRARAHLIPQNAFGSIPSRVFNTIQVTPPGWADSTASGFLATFFLCGAPFDHRWYCNSRFDRGLRKAESLQAADPRAAARAWASLDRLVMQDAAAVPLVNTRYLELVSRRVRNYEYNPSLGAVVDQFSLP